MFFFFGNYIVYYTYIKSFAWKSRESFLNWILLSCLVTPECNIIWKIGKKTQRRLFHVSHSHFVFVRCKFNVDYRRCCRLLLSSVRPKESHTVWQNVCLNVNQHPYAYIGLNQYTCFTLAHYPHTSSTHTHIHRISNIYINTNSFRGNSK